MRIFDQLVQRLEHLDEIVPKDRHVLVGLAGIPGGGKSTISHTLKESTTLSLQIVPMDGFHFSKEFLRGSKDPSMMFARRGAPFTFDSEKFVELVANIRNQEYSKTQPEEVILAPAFDHQIGDPIDDAIKIKSTTRFIIIEGNYVLLNEQPWSEIRSLCDEMWMVVVAPEEVEMRLAKRHVAAGIEPTIEKGRLRAQQNDIINGRYIYEHSFEPDFVIDNSRVDLF
ncbi:P-loop containing nucleoside triphosphate hydrolase protein [Lipomyces oligophaga]|uniref:P-loop containing nucleoside triphosphate hydrolase protein n=1 Tax=Lipomyces oligophaga TaxID=45792 RepID=UPI0034CFFD60